MNIYIYIYVYIYVCAYICVYIYMKEAHQNGKNVNPFEVMASVTDVWSGPWTGWIGPAPV